MKENRVIHYLFAIITVAIAVLVDQWTKHLAVIHLKEQEPFVIINNVFQLRYLENRGAAFGLLQNQRLFFYFSTAVIILFVIWFYSRVPMNKMFFPLRVCAVFVVAGGIGNCIDRVRLNYVVDFFYFELIDFPIFNVADIYVTVTLFLLCYLILFYYKEEDLDRIFNCRK